MDNEYSIEVNNIKKSFKIYYDKGHTLKETSLFKKRRNYEMREVLKGISFKVKKGEAVALIGHNGCGKSTTLKMLTRIMYPDEGTITMRGRVSSLIELGAGFHPDMTGRENIFINASIFGLTHKEIEDRVDRIIEFSELEEFIDNPVRTYSSGMYMRLAFAVAINVDADILLIDEILAVGDSAFQAKCFDKLREIKADGTTIVIVSHDTSQIEKICETSIWIHEGEIKRMGIPSEVDMEYADFLGKRRGERQKKESEDNKIEEQNRAILTAEGVNQDGRKIEILDAFLVGKEEKQTNFKVGEPVTLKVHYKKNTDVNKPLMGLKIYRNDMVNAFGINSKNERFDLDLKDEGWIELFFPEWNFVQGQYHLDVAIREENMLICDYKTKIVTFTTYSQIVEDGIAHLDHEWR